MNLRDAHFEIKDVTSSGTFAGYGSVYGNIDQGDDVVEAGAFNESLASYAAKGRMPALLWQHKSSEPIGAYTLMRDDPQGLYVEGKLAMKTQRGAEAHELMQMKAISGLSIGFQTREDSYDQKTGIRSIKKADLWEVSLVTFPMNDSARISSVKSIEQMIDLKTCEHYLRESCGVSRAEATAFIARVKSLLQSDSEESAHVAQMIAAIRRNADALRA